jgi:hypothetical protein
MKRESSDLGTCVRLGNLLARAGRGVGSRNKVSRRGEA